MCCSVLRDAGIRKATFLDWDGSEVTMDVSEIVPKNKSWRDEIA